MVADLGIAPALRSPPYRKFLVQRGNVISQLPKDRWAGAGSMTKLQHLIDIVLNHGKDLCRYMEKMSVIRAKTQERSTDAKDSRTARQQRIYVRKCSLLSAMSSGRLSKPANHPEMCFSNSRQNFPLQQLQVRLLYYEFDNQLLIQKIKHLSGVAFSLVGICAAFFRSCSFFRCSYSFCPSHSFRTSLICIRDQHMVMTRLFG